jgi:hypothetical protein
MGPRNSQTAQVELDTAGNFSFTREISADSAGYFLVDVKVTPTKNTIDNVELDCFDSRYTPK